MSKTRHGHVICPDRMSLREALKVIYSSTCDYRVGINEFRTWILRTAKPEAR